MNYYFIEFWYEHYCQGWEIERTRELVQADSFDEACELLERSFTNAYGFKDRTIRK